ncbi:hypothetical protein MELA_02430 [Candidatus Methylomirabilis lanthanidiphila]|uniref:Tetrahaem cytochrome domain-containing protein n=1 Tax=Candidatus Methylomirabilis lanthanidiphila TaxID=2211376 RepID=A0A564ZLS0_9BACT|nr:cytochrome c3 family protein [Candidatus Methylomirabilis lanthanidiphila]VUZ86036.1 hypothetical protein MELA_02430 [Candidatus Methylomirabilis lanthanidiphila]
MTTGAKAGGPRTWQNRAYLVGLCVGLGITAFTVLRIGEWFHAKGPMNTGHSKLGCAACHKNAPGSFRQQIQANLRHAFGRRAVPAFFGRLPVGNADCMACHERPNDRHPVYRFFEPRFSQARETLRPHQCVSCHAEHKGRRVTLTAIDYCVNCHKDTRLKKDPIDVPHADLIARKQWDSCLGCHDFHGNHIMQIEKSVEKRTPPEKIRAYFDGGSSPYGTNLHYKAKQDGQGQDG